MTTEPTPESKASRNPSAGIALVMTILLTLGITAIGTGMFLNSYTSRSTAINYKNKIREFAASDGVMTLLAQEALNGRAGVYLDSTRFGKIYGSVWNNLPTADTTVTKFKNHIGSHPTPNYTDSSTYLGSYWNNSKPNYQDHYGVKWTGYLMPPLTGNYTFYLRTDDVGSFYLSTDNTIGNLPGTATCYTSSYTPSWASSGSGVSQSIYLKAGQRYYFEFYHVENTGGDFGQVGWTGPDWFSEFPVLGSHLSQYSSDPNSTNLVNIGTSSDSEPVQYQLSPSGENQYALFTQSYKTGSAGDTLYRVPLNQFLSMEGASAKPPDTVWMRVLIHDEHADYSNPEFEPDSNYYPGSFSLQSGMVMNKFSSTPFTSLDRTTGYLSDFTSAYASYFGLDSIPKPRKNTAPQAHTVKDCFIDKWFRDVTTVDSYPKYKPKGDSNAIQNGKSFDWGYLNNCDTVISPHDTDFKNMTFEDSLPLIRETGVTTNTYKALRNTDSGGAGDYFPIDHKGFGNDAVLDHAHNFSYCMESHSTFQDFAGLTFSFQGDDDIWVYVNDSLVIDLGGIHQARDTSVSFDNLPLTYGQIYPFDLFYCERHTDRSTLRIETNMPMVRTTGAPTTSWQRDYGSMD